MHECNLACEQLDVVAHWSDESSHHLIQILVHIIVVLIVSVFPSDSASGLCCARESSIETGSDDVIGLRNTKRVDKTI